MKALRVERISKNFGGVEALKGVTFSIDMGEKLAIIGPNGAGKTTLLNVINGQLSVSSGSIYLFDKDITNLSIHQRAHLGIARAFQSSTLFPSMSVLNNILLAIHGKKMSRHNMFRPFRTYEEYISKAEKYLQSVNLYEKKDVLVNDLSHGDQKKLEIAMSLASEPKLLLLDEPSAGLTSEESADVSTIIKNLSPDISVIVVAHDMDLVFGLAERIIVLHYGQIICEGTPKDVQCDRKVMEIYMGLEDERKYVESY